MLHPDGSLHPPLRPLKTGRLWSLSRLQPCDVEAAAVGAAGALGGVPRWMPPMRSPSWSRGAWGQRFVDGQAAE